LGDVVGFGEALVGERAEKKRERKLRKIIMK